MKFVIAMMIIVMLILLSGCEARITIDNTGNNVPELSYFKDDYGNCFASVERIRSQNYSFTSIPCENMPE